MPKNEVKMETTLDQLKPGNRGKVIQVRGERGTRRRILDMGIIPGAGIEVIRRAPLGDPVEFRIKGYNLSLRKAEAKLISVNQEGEDV